MKKTLLIVSAFVALLACSKETPVAEEPLQKLNEEIKVNFTITRNDEGIDTKGTIKSSAWANGDVVFIFFKDVTAPKYLEMKYNGTVWVSTEKGEPGEELKASDFAGKESGKMTAIYLPYGNDLTVSAKDGSFVFSETYSGYFYYQEGIDYTLADNTLTSPTPISLSVASPMDGDDRLIHFDVTGHADSHTYELFNDYVKPLQLISISSTATVVKNIGAQGDAITGYPDALFVSFSGVLDKTAVGAAQKYWFSVRDTYDGTLYYRNCGTKTISGTKAIGIGNLSSVWNVATPGAFSVSGTEQVTFARSNLSYLGATGSDKPWRLMKYPWSVIETGIEDGGSYPRVNPIPDSDKDFGLFGWATSGYDGVAPWKYNTTASEYYGTNGWDGKVDPIPDTTPTWGKGNTSNDYSLRDWAKNNTIYEYNGNSMSGSWRTPTRDNLQYIANIGVSGRTQDYRFTVACVNGRNGAILFPDSFVPMEGFPEIKDLNTVKGNLGYTNSFSLLQWNKLEAAGVVFLYIFRSIPTQSEAA